MTLVWLSSGLPADSSELAASLPSDLTLVPPNSSADPNSAADVGVLPVGSLCVATAFETELLARLAQRPAGVRLLVVGPEGHLGAPSGVTAPAAPPFGRPADVVTSASSIGDLVTAIRAAAQSPVPAPGFPAAPVTSPAIVTQRVRGPLRTRLLAAGAVLVGLAIGGIVIAATEGTSTATAGPAANRFGGGGGFGGQAPGGAALGGAGTVPGGPGTVQGGPGTVGGGGVGGGVGGVAGQELLTCLRQHGITTSTSQQLRNTNDPKLRQAFLTCVQQLGISGPGRASSQVTVRP